MLEDCTGRAGLVICSVHMEGRGQEDVWAAGWNDMYVVGSEASIYFMDKETGTRDYF